MRATYTLLLLLAGASGLIASRMAYETVDYSVDAGPALDALARFDLHGFFAHEPQMGAASLLLRWPFAALARLWEASQLDVYRLGLFVCLLATAAIGVWLARELQRRGRSAAAVGLLLGLWLLSPAALSAANLGHPEEMLGGALCVLAVVLAGSGRETKGGVALGLALATKQWALVAVPATLLGARRPLRTLAVALAVWLPLELPLVLGNFDAYRRLGHFGVKVMSPPGAWWPLTPLLPDHLIAGLARPAVLVAAVAASALVWRAGGGRTTESRLALLAVVFLLRVLLDPTGNHYFAVPFLMALLAFEALSFARPPLLSAGAAALLALTFSPALGGEAVTSLFYAAWAIPLLGYLSVSACRTRSTASTSFNSAVGITTSAASGRS